MNVTMTLSAKKVVFDNIPENLYIQSRLTVVVL